MKNPQITLLVLLVLLIQEYAISQPVLGYAAIATMELDYSNPDNLKESGSYCDFLIHTCDVFFDICLSSPGNTCDLFHQQTRIFMDTTRITLAGDSALNAFLKSPFPKDMKIFVKILDFDSNNDADIIGKYNGEIVDLTTTPEFVEIPLTPSSTSRRAKTSISFKFTMKITCLSDHYNKRCDTYCKPNGYSYICSPEGQRICVSDFFGEFCNETDICIREPCVPEAQCIPKFRGRKCICNGGDYPECYPNSDPCNQQPCLNQGVCYRSPESARGFVCTCPTYYTGIYCENRLSLCKLAEAEEKAAFQQIFMITHRNRLKPTPQFKSSSSAVCLNGGVCVDHPTMFSFFCKCATGWTGDRCEIVANKSNKVVLISSLVCGILGLLFIIGTLVYFFKRRRWKKRVENLQARNTVTYEQTPYSASHIRRADWGKHPITSQDSSYEPMLPYIHEKGIIAKDNMADSDDNPPLPLRPANLPSLHTTTATTV